MNIFVLDKNPYRAASYLCDAHVVKMIVESCQLLSSADQLFYNKPQENRYRIAWQNHPCCKCLNNIENYNWLCIHLGGLLLEYSARYNHKIHSCDSLWKEYWSYDGEIDFSKLTFPKVTGGISIGGDDIDSVVESYRNYYHYKKDHLSRFNYKLGNMPEWLIT